MHSLCILCLGDVVSITKEQNIRPTCQSCKEPFDESQVAVKLAIDSPAQNNSLCSRHPTKEVFCFCDTCQCPICSDCITDGHAGHAHVELAKYQSVLLEDVTKLTERISMIETALNGLATIQVHLNNRLTAIANEIDAAFNPLIQQLPERAVQLENRCGRLKEEAIKEIKADIKKIQLQQMSLNFTKDHILLVQANAEALQRYTNASITQYVRLHQIVSARTRLLQKTNLNLNPQPEAKDNIHFIFSQPPNILSYPVEKLGRIVKKRITQI